MKAFIVPYISSVKEYSLKNNMLSDERYRLVSLSIIFAVLELQSPRSKAVPAFRKSGS